jgi:hypothetical protein
LKYRRNTHKHYTLTGCEVDERGELSPQLKRGVISQDALFELKASPSFDGKSTAYSVSQTGCVVVLQPCFAAGLERFRRRRALSAGDTSKGGAFCPTNVLY